MVAVDANIVVRILTGDDPEQLEKAVRLVESEGIWIGKTVALETARVLQQVYQIGMNEIRQSLRALSETNGVLFEAEDRLLLALELTESGVDIADAMHLTFCDHSQAAFHTFDKDFHYRASKIGHEIFLVS